MDTSPFYLTFINAPHSASSVTLGTCRIRPGSSTGGSFSLLSPDFETGGSGACIGNETNLIRSLAAGGVSDANGLSQVIYVGTNGEGPLVPTIPRGGNVWVTTNADAGAGAWADVTQSINPQGFPVSGIALDAADPLGKTAYVAIMGFHTPHLWKTTNAGISWTDFTATLPDAPVNVIVVDSGSSLLNGMVYVGTDVGVFASSTGAPNWSEVGPTAGQQGFLPNVAVTTQNLQCGRAETPARGHLRSRNLGMEPDHDSGFPTQRSERSVNRHSRTKLNLRRDDLRAEWL